MTTDDDERRHERDGEVAFDELEPAYDAAVDTLVDQLIGVINDRDLDPEAACEGFEARFGDLAFDVVGIVLSNPAFSDDPVQQY